MPPKWENEPEPGAQLKGKQRKHRVDFCDKRVKDAQWTTTGGVCQVACARCSSTQGRRSDHVARRGSQRTLRRSRMGTMRIKYLSDSDWPPRLCQAQS